MKPQFRLRLKPKPHTPRTGAGACLLALTTAAVGPLVTAPGSHALSSAHTNRAHRHPGFRHARASWYYDDGHRTACGFHAKFGVAHRTLPCGRRVTFWHRGHRVRAVVDDRGPYISGRTWDLDEHTASALHVSGVAYVWAKS